MANRLEKLVHDVAMGASQVLYEQLECLCRDEEKVDLRDALYQHTRLSIETFVNYCLEEVPDIYETLAPSVN